MYREVQDVRTRMRELQIHTHNAILGDDTRAMTQEGGAAQVMADEMARILEHALQADSVFGEPRVERDFVQAAWRALQDAVTQGQRLALGTDVPSLRQGLLEFKTYVDFADAYTRAALGAESLS